MVTDLLVANFPYIFDPQYTARLEEELVRGECERRGIHVTLYTAKKILRRQLRSRYWDAGKSQVN